MVSRAPSSVFIDIKDDNLKDVVLFAPPSQEMLKATMDPVDLLVQEEELDNIKFLALMGKMSIRKHGRGKPI